MLRARHIFHHPAKFDSIDVPRPRRPPRRSALNADHLLPATLGCLDFPLKNRVKAILQLRLLVKVIDRTLPTHEREALFRKVKWRTDRLMKDSKLNYTATSRARQIRDSVQYLLGLSDEAHSQQRASVLHASLHADLSELSEITLVVDQSEASLLKA